MRSSTVYREIHPKRKLEGTGLEPVVEYYIWDAGGIVALTQAQDVLLAWLKATVTDERVLPDYHRLQLEHWVWSRVGALPHERVLDVGVEIPRTWLACDAYTTLGSDPGPGIDFVGDLLDLPFPAASYDVVICTEVLEHCADPFTAVREMRRVLAPGGVLLVTSPFLWSWHGRDDEEACYPDYWRFTRQGWEQLLKDFATVEVTACAWTSHGFMLYQLLRQAEGWGLGTMVEGHTGYLAEAVK